MPEVADDFTAFCDGLRVAGLFEAGRPIAVARAPGRLDVMGADYQENLVSAINLRQIFTPDPNNVLLELNFFAD